MYASDKHILIYLSIKYIIWYPLGKKHIYASVLINFYIDTHIYGFLISNKISIFFLLVNNF